LETLYVTPFDHVIIQESLFCLCPDVYWFYILNFAQQDNQLGGLVTNRRTKYGLGSNPRHVLFVARGILQKNTNDYFLLPPQ
jgi:hypothetical protein